MTDKHQRVATFITRRAFPDPAEPVTVPTRTSFAEWSRRTERMPFVPKLDPARTLGIHTRLMATVYTWREITVEVGDPFVSITPDRPMIRHPQPFNEDGLTDACRDFIIEAVRQAVDHDGRHRTVTWPEPPSNQHGEAA